MNLFAGHGDALTAGIFTPDGKTIVTASADSTVRVWNPKTAECTSLLQGNATMLPNRLMQY
jgi:WD40 repeat protein